MTFTHPLDTVEGSLVLDQCFRFLGCFCRRFGLLPITIKPNGYAEFCILSLNFISTILYVALFIGLTIIYFPMYLESTAALKNSYLFISEHLFFGGQMFGVVVTIILIPYIAWRTSILWNNLVPVIEFCVDQGYKERFKEPYRRSRVSMILFIITALFYSFVCWRTFSAGLELEKITGKAMYCIHAFGYIIYFLLACCHLAHGFVMLFFLFTMRRCFLILQEVIERGSLAAEVCKGIARQKIEENLKIYESLTRTCDLLGRTFGLYLVFELMVMMMSILMNAFTMLSGFEQRDALTTTLSFVGYFGWIILLTEGGERFRKEAYHCSQSLKDSVYLHSTDPPILHKVSQLKVPKFSAMGYFTVNRRLAITVGATFATYLVVIIQFKLNSSMNNNCNSASQ